MRARAISLRKVDGSRSKTRRWRPIAGRFEVNLDVEAEAAFGREELGEAAIVIDPNRLDDLQVAAGTGLLGDPDQIDRRDEISGRAVHDRGFRPINLDQDVVDPEPREGGNVTQTSLSTTLGDASGAGVSTVEHLLAALSGLRVDNVGDRDRRAGNADHGRLRAGFRQ